MLATTKNPTPWRSHGKLATGWEVEIASRSLILQVHEAGARCTGGNLARISISVDFFSTGTSDSQGRDYEHALAMANILKDKVKSVDVFLLLFNGGNSRFQASIIKLLKLYESIFSKDMWKNAITEVKFTFI